jgi:hypothetical protein
MDPPNKTGLQQHGITSGFVTRGRQDSHWMKETAPMKSGPLRINHQAGGLDRIAATPGV